MESHKFEHDLIQQQYELVREEVSRSIFLQYDVIKIGTAFLSTLLVAVPTVYAIFGEERLFLLAVTLVALAFVSMSFVFIMGAGEIRIMRGAAFSNRTFSVLSGKEFLATDKFLVWDRFVSEWNRILYGDQKAWKYQERIYLAMPFLVVAILSDIGALISLVLWTIHAQKVELTHVLSLCGLGVAMGIQVWLYGWPARLSKALSRAYEQCSNQTSVG